MKKLLVLALIAILIVPGCGQTSDDQSVTITASEYENLKNAASSSSAAPAASSVNEAAETPEATPEATPEPTPEATPEPTEEPAPTEAAPSTDGLSAEEKNALASAQNYLAMMAFSRQGLIDQLSSEYGDKYPVEAATKAVDYLEENNLVDWNEQAYKAAQNYLSMMSFSQQQLVEQLSSDYGDKYTQEQAEYGAAKAYEEQ